ncbi:MAG: hypothetical protein AABW59_04390 [archaeon]
MNLVKIRRIAKGWSSYIFLAKDSKGNQLVLKEVREKSPRKDLAHREGEMLLRTNSVGVGPKVIEVNYKDNFVAMEYISGPKFLDWVMSENFDKEVSKEDLYFFIKDLYRQCLALDSLGLSHNQLQVGKNILVKSSNGKYFPVIIDFEKATMKTPDTTRNLGQIMSFLFYNPNGAVAKKVREKLEIEL